MYLCPECQTYYHGAAAPEACLLDGSPLVEPVEPPASADLAANLERLGTTVDRYELVAFLGAGGMGAVFIARRLAPVDLTPMLSYGALKLLAPGEPFETCEQFEREAKSLLDVRHDNIARLQDWGNTPEGGYYLVTELVRGPSLAQLIRKQRRLEPSVAVTIAHQLLSALSAVHSSRIVHRDIKPSNVMLSRQADGQYRAKLIDFGIAARRADAAPGSAPGPFQGTPAYMAPEQFHGQSNERSDLYAVGLCLFEMLAGRRPFADSDCGVQRRQRAEAPVPPLFDHPVDGSHIQVLEGFIRVLLNKNPAERPPSALAALAWLEESFLRPAASSPAVESASSATPQRERDAPAPADLPPTLPPSRDLLSDSRRSQPVVVSNVSSAPAPGVARRAPGGNLRRAAPFALALAFAALATTVLRAACSTSPGPGPANPPPAEPEARLATATAAPARQTDELRPEDVAPTAAPDGPTTPRSPPGGASLASPPEAALRVGAAAAARPSPPFPGQAGIDASGPPDAPGATEERPGNAAAPLKRRRCTRTVELRTHNYHPALMPHVAGAEKWPNQGSNCFSGKVPCELRRFEVSAVGGGRRETVVLGKGSGPYWLGL